MAHEHNGKRIAERRAQLGLTQRDLAARLGTTQPTVARIEAVGIHTLDAIERYAHALEVTPQWLAFGTSQIQAERRMSAAKQLLRTCTESGRLNRATVDAVEAFLKNA